MKYNSLFSVLVDLHPDETPIFIPVFNQPTLLKNTLDQFESIGMNNRIVIYDNASSYEPMIDYLNECSKTYDVVLSNKNTGPRIFTEDLQVLSLMPEYFIVTDPDLYYNEYLPANFIDEMKDEIKKHHLAKIGFAIEVYDSSEQEMFQDAEAVLKWEEPYWQEVLGKTKSGNKIYDAYIDTTFSLNKRDTCLDSRKIGLPTFRYLSARVADDYTCRHIGWWKKELMPQTREELDFYLKTQQWSHTEIHYYK
jgi:hypothetical protein